MDDLTIASMDDLAIVSLVVMTVIAVANIIVLIFLGKTYKSTNKINEATIARYTTEQAIKLEHSLKGVSDEIHMLNEITNIAINEKNLNNVPVRSVFEQEVKGELQGVHLAVIKILNNGSFKDFPSYRGHFIDVINTNNDIRDWVQTVYNPLMDEIENAEVSLNTGALDQDLFFTRLRQPLPFFLDENKDEMLNPLYKNSLDQADKTDQDELAWLEIHKRFKDRFDEYRKLRPLRRRFFLTIRFGRN